MAKATLYSLFGSKDELIRAYLAGAARAPPDPDTPRRSSPSTHPRERILGVFDVLGSFIAEPGFHGCAFMNAAAESTAGKRGRARRPTSRARGRGRCSQT